MHEVMPIPQILHYASSINNKGTAHQKQNLCSGIVDGRLRCNRVFMLPSFNLRGYTLDSFQTLRVRTVQYELLAGLLAANIWMS